MSSLLDAMKQKWNEKISEKKCYLIKLSKKKKKQMKKMKVKTRKVRVEEGEPPPHPLSLSRDIFQMRRDEGQCDKIKIPTYVDIGMYSV